MRVVEAILSSLVILDALIFINTMSTPPKSRTFEPCELERVGYNALHVLDERGILRRFIYCQNVAFGYNLLKSALRVSLPPDVYFSLTIYSLDGFGRPHLEGEIVYGEPEMFKDSSVVSTVTYVLAGSNAEYDPKILVLALIRR
jgi:hypothetical protein